MIDTVVIKLAATMWRVSKLGHPALTSLTFLLNSIPSVVHTVDGDPSSNGCGHSIFEDGRIGFHQRGSLFIQRIIGVDKIRKEQLQALKYTCDRVEWSPVLSQDIQTNFALLVDVWVINLRFPTW